jgi:hypothetical protein
VWGPSRLQLSLSSACDTRKKVDLRCERPVHQNGPVQELVRPAAVHLLFGICAGRDVSSRVVSWAELMRPCGSREGWLCAVDHTVHCAGWLRS